MSINQLALPGGNPGVLGEKGSRAMLGELGKILGRAAAECSPQATRVLLAMIAGADTTGRWRGTMVQLGDRLGRSRYRLGDAVDELEAAELVRREDRGTFQLLPTLECGASAAQAGLFRPNVAQAQRSRSEKIGDVALAQHAPTPTKERGRASAGAGKYQSSFQNTHTGNSTTTSQGGRVAGGGGGGASPGIPEQGGLDERQTHAVVVLVKAGVMRPTAQRVVEGAEVELVEAVVAEWQRQQSDKRKPSVAVLVHRLKQLLTPGSDFHTHATDLVQRRREAEARAERRKAAPQPVQDHRAVKLDTGGDEDRADLQALAPNQAAALCAHLDADAMSRAGAPWTTENFCATPGRTMRAALALRDMRTAGTLPAPAIITGDNGQ